MKRPFLTIALFAVLGGSAYAQDMVMSSGSEPLFPYDDQEPWKHGYFQIVPFYHGHQAFRPYNYKQVFSQSNTAAGWGMPQTMPYSQQFWNRYKAQADLQQGAIGGGTISYQYAPSFLNAPMVAQQPVVRAPRIAPQFPGRARQLQQTSVNTAPNGQVRFAQPVVQDQQPAQPNLFPAQSGPALP